jgi:amino acid adenylation domain-containing protein
VGPERFVGIYMKSSVEMIVGLLGILKAGGAYVALDPAYPQERLAFMLEDTQPSVLVTQQPLVGEIPEQRAYLVCLDNGYEVITGEDEQNPISGVTSSNLACVFYTSGTTGKPKGAMIEHKSLVNYTQFASAEYAVEPGDRVLQFASISYDISAEEIYPCLTRGATLVMLRRDALLTPAYRLLVSAFLEECQACAVTVASLSTTAWHAIVVRLEAEGLELPSSLRLVIIGGERVLPERLATWHRHVSQRVRLVNTYGPTEATVITTTCELEPSGNPEPPLPEVPIGCPIANVEVHILDDQLQPAPTGVPGELHIGGANVARGYLNRPELTEEKFIPHPFNDEPGARLYKSGDLARYLPDGNLEFLGRLDRQVKISGFRVELGEIESVLNQHGAVEDSTVIAREDESEDEEESDDKYLVAYLVPGPEDLSATLTSSGLRSFLQEKLPEYMVPSAFVIVETQSASSGEIATLRLKQL